jgi:hypothetical protein
MMQALSDKAAVIRDTIKGTDWPFFQINLVTGAFLLETFLFETHNKIPIYEARNSATNTDNGRDIIRDIS